MSNQKELTPTIKPTETNQINILNPTDVKTISDRKFDFASLSKIMSEVKKTLWKIEQKKSHFDAQRMKYQNTCFKLLQPGRTEERVILDELLRKGGFNSSLGFNTKDGLSGLSVGEKRVRKEKLFRDDASCRNDDTSITDEEVSPDKFVNVDGNKYTVTVI